MERNARCFFTYILLPALGCAIIALNCGATIAIHLAGVSLQLGRRHFKQKGQIKRADMVERLLCHVLFRRCRVCVQ